MARLISIDAIELVLRCSKGAVGAGEYPPNTNRGPFVRRVLARTGNKEGDPWCASWVTDVGTIALEHRWPVLRSASVAAICEWARVEKCRYIPSASGMGKPQVGDLYALWNEKLQRWAHIGFVIAVGDGTQITVRDGNTSDPKDTDPDTNREGWLVAEKPRTLTKKDRIIRWIEALP
jgi:hypothetical protein